MLSKEEVIALRDDGMLIFVTAFYHSSDKVSCLTPVCPTSVLHTVNVNVFLNGTEFIEPSYVKYRFIPPPVVFNVVPSFVSKNGGDLIFVTGDFFKYHNSVRPAIFMFGETPVEAQPMSKV